MSPIKIKAQSSHQPAPVPKQETSGQEPEQHKTLHMEECPIFYPSYQEFHEKSFTELIAECEAKSGDAAIFKVSDSLLTLPR
jgi:hypothetical protein